MFVECNVIEDSSLIQVENKEQPGEDFNCKKAYNIIEKINNKEIVLDATETVIGYAKLNK